MDTEKIEKKTRRILSVSLAAAGLLANTTSALSSVTVPPTEKANTSVETSINARSRTLPGLLVLQTANGQHQTSHAACLAFFAQLTLISQFSFVA